MTASTYCIQSFIRYWLSRLCEKCTGKPYPFLVIDTTLASDNSSRFRKILLERIKKIIMAIDDKIRDEKIQYDINREAAKISALSSGKIDKYEFLIVYRNITIWSK